MLAFVLFAAISLLAAIDPDSATQSPAPSVSPGPVLVTLGDSITAGAHGSEYPRKLGALIGAASVTNLGIAGEFSGPLNYQIPGGAHMIYGGVLADEVGKIPLNATIVTLYIGTNDVWFARLELRKDVSKIGAAYAGAAQSYAANMEAIIAGIRQRVPQARIIVADVPNPANRPGHMKEMAALRNADSGLVESIRKAVIATGATVVDLECDPAMYDDANFGGPLDVHPVDSGFEAIAADFANAILHGSTPKSCAYEAPIVPQP